MILLIFLIIQINKQIVYNTCQASRLSAVSEQSCYDVQERYNIEYLCEQNNTSLSNRCWVEVK